MLERAEMDKVSIYTLILLQNLLQRGYAACRYAPRCAGKSYGALDF